MKIQIFTFIGILYVLLQVWFFNISSLGWRLNASWVIITTILFTLLIIYANATINYYKGEKKMTIKEAKSILNEYRNRNYNSTFRDELELAKAIDTILPKYVELESYDTPLKVIKTPHERMLELGFIISDETKYFIAYVFKGFKIIIYKEEKVYQAYSYGDNYNPINLQLAEVLVDYLKELENEQ